MQLICKIESDLSLAALDSPPKTCIRLKWMVPQREIEKRYDLNAKSTLTVAQLDEILSTKAIFALLFSRFK